MIRAYINATTKAVTRAVIPGAGLNQSIINNTLRDNLISLWELNETWGNKVQDSHGLSNGVNTNATVNKTGLLNKSYYFPGTSPCKLVVPYNSSFDILNFNANNITISLWVKGKPSAPLRLVEQNNSIYYSVSIQVFSGPPYDLRLRIYDGTNSCYVLINSEDVWDNNWHHIVMVNDISQGKLFGYLDGEYYGEVVNNLTNDNNNTEDIVIGSTKWDTNRYVGYIDQVAIWNKRLSDLEIKGLYNSGLGLPYKQFEPGILNRFNNGKLILTFDDLRESQYTNAFPILVNEGVSATFYVIGSRVGTSTYATWDNAVSMYNAGMDMQCHTFNHVDMTTLTEQQIVDSLDANDAAFTLAGIPIPQHISYPFGAYNDSVISHISNRRFTGRRAIGFDSLYTYSQFYKDELLMQMRSIEMDELDTTKMSYLKSIMDITQSSHGCLLLYGHRVEETTGSYVTTTADLTEIIQYAKTIGIDIITVSQLYNLIT